MFFDTLTTQCQRRMRYILSTTAMGAVCLTSQIAIAASGCATVTDITPVNKPPMADIYRLDKRGIATGSQVFQLLNSFTPLGFLASGLADTTVEVAGSAIRRGVVEAERKQELATQKWEGVFDVTYKPDFGESITITIRDSEIKRYSLEKGARVVMFDPNRDILITTDEGQKVTRTRPSVHVPLSGLLSTIQSIPAPINGELTDDHKKFCYAGQAGPDYLSMSGPWNPKDYKRPWLTRDEIKEAGRMISSLRSEVKDKPQSTDVERDQASINLQELELASARMWEYNMVLSDASEKTITAQKSRAVSVAQKLDELKQRTGLSSSMGIDAWLNFVNESMTARVTEHLAEKLKTSSP